MRGEKDVTSYYTFADSVDGTLKVNKKDVTLKSADLEKTYDGTALVNGNTPLATNDGWVGDDGVEAYIPTICASAPTATSSDNTIVCILDILNVISASANLGG